MAAANYTIEINQGETFSKNFIWCDSTEAPRDLTGYTARLQARASMSSGATILDSAGASPTTGLSVTIPTPANGTVLVTMTAACTSAIPCEGLYSIELTGPSSVVKRLVEGAITLSSELNR